MGKLVERLNHRVIMRLLTGLALLLTATQAQAQQAVTFGSVPQNITIASVTAQQKVTINVVTQQAHTLTYKWTGIPTNTSCDFYFDGSIDGSTWKILAVGFATNTTPAVLNEQTVYANGFYPYLRLDVDPTSVSGCATTALTVNYVGTQVPLPINPLALNAIATNTALTGPQALTPIGISFIVQPVIIEGFSCTSTNTALSWLQIYTITGGVTLGNGNFSYQTPIPAGTATVPSVFTYTGPPIFVNGPVTASATTTAGGNTGATAVQCNFQLNITGPFYPFTATDSN